MKELNTLNSEEQAIVVHEAGHVAVAISCGATCVTVDLKRNGERIATTNAPFLNENVEDFKKRVKVAMAGPIAEREYTKLNIDHGGGDRKKINEWVMQDCLDKEQLDKQTKDIVATHWEGILRVANLIAKRFNQGSREIDHAELVGAFNNREQN